MIIPLRGNQKYKSIIRGGYMRDILIACLIAALIVVAAHHGALPS
jgi:hypothetical protein